MRALSWYVLFVSTFAPVAIAQRPSEPEWIERAKNELPKVWERYLQVANRLDSTCEVQTAKLAGRERTRPFTPFTRQVWAIRCGECGLWEEARTSQDDTTPAVPVLQCDNPDYHFALTKGRNGYALLDYAIGKRQLPLSRQGGLPHEGAYSELRGAQDAVTGANQHELKELRWDRTKQLVHLKYTYSLGDSRVTNELWLDPEKDWRTIERRGETQSAVFTDVYTYGITIEGLEFPTKVVSQTRYKVDNAPPDFEAVARVLSLKVTAKELNDFRLSAFGLPEPADVRPVPPKTPRSLWFIGAAVLLAILSFVFRYLARRRESASQT